MGEMEKNPSRILVIVSDQIFAKLLHATTESRERGEVRCHDFVRRAVGELHTGDFFDASVIEAACFSDFDSYPTAYEAAATRVLVVAKDVQEESRVLRVLRPNDDIIRTDAIETQLLLRLERILAGSRTTRIDMLSGLSNRAALFEHAKTVLAQGVNPDNPLSVVIIDLDNFKRLNDTYGHQVGDLVIHAVGGAIAASLPDALCLARYGGEEFLALLRADRELARARAEIVRAAIARLEPGPGVRITGSFGVATATTMPGEFAELVAAADRFLYAAKQNGRDCVVDQADFHALADSRDEDPDIVDFDNHVRVLTDRLAEYLSQRGRNLARVFQDEADRDGLTGIYNRRYFDRRISREFEFVHRSDRPLALLFFDLDDFGAVNRTYGYPAGDRLLKAITSVIVRSVRATDWVARYGGEELCAILPDTPVEAAVVIAERILAEIRLVEVVSVDGRSFGATASVGVVVTQGDDAGIPEFVQRASDKVREAKRAGKNAVAR
jgi:diguanylate cyclase (GGDEF)-like protein